MSDGRTRGSLWGRRHLGRGGRGECWEGIQRSGTARQPTTGRHGWSHETGNGADGHGVEWLEFLPETLIGGDGIRCFLE